MDLYLFLMLAFVVALTAGAIFFARRASKW